MGTFQLAWRQRRDLGLPWWKQSEVVLGQRTAEKQARSCDCLKLRSTAPMKCDVRDRCGSPKLTDIVRQ